MSRGARARAARRAAAAAWIVSAALCPLVDASTLLLLNLDPPGEGLNDPTPVVSRGGNPGTTLGEARLAAVELAATLWGENLASEVPIVIAVSFLPLGGTSVSAPLGLGGPEDAFRDFAGAPLPGVWYPAALADRLAGLDVEGTGAPDLHVFFNLDVDGNEVLGTGRFYYGFDGRPPAGDVDLVSVALHEMGHGLGVGPLFDLATGTRLLGYDDVYLLHLERHGATPPDFASMTDAQRAAAATAEGEIHWSGAALSAAAAGRLTAGLAADGHVEMHAPPVLEERSSLSHFASVMSPDDLMEPFYSGEQVDLELVLALLQDLGWGTAPQCFAQSLP